MWGEEEGKDKRMDTRILYKNNIQSTTTGNWSKKKKYVGMKRWGASELVCPSECINLHATVHPYWKQKSRMKTDSSPFSGPFNSHPHTPTAIRFIFLLRATVIQVRYTEEDVVAIRYCNPGWDTDYWGFSSFFPVPSGKYLDSKSNRPRPLPFKSLPIYHSTLYKWPNPSSRSMTHESTQPLTEMSTRNLPVGKGGPARKADNLIAISESIV
jgi:hypothetical protein